MISSPSESSDEEACNAEPPPPKAEAGDPEPSKDKAMAVDEVAEPGGQVEGAASESAPAELHTGPMVTVRVRKALEKSSSFAEFKKNRLFVFIHMFSGKEDVLGKEITRQAEAEGLDVYIVNLDKLTDESFDLSKDQPYCDILEDARGGEYDGGHAGPPCGSFSMARYNEGHGPPPVRSLAEIYGLSSNSPRQQAEADEGTILFVRSLQVIGEIIQSQRMRKVPECGTVENPPGSSSQKEGPAWRLPESEEWMEEFQAEVAQFNTCAYQMKEQRRWWKMAQFAGRLEGLGTLRRKCSCIKGFKHEALIGKSRTSEAARYPQELVQEYAKMVIRNFKATLNLEWWRGQELIKKKELNAAQQRWIKSKEKTTTNPPVPDKAMGEWRGTKRAFEAGNTMLDHLPSSSKDSKRARKDVEDALTSSLVECATLSSQ